MYKGKEERRREASVEALVIKLSATNFEIREYRNNESIIISACNRVRDDGRGKDEARPASLVLC